MGDRGRIEVNFPWGDSPEGDEWREVVRRVERICAEHRYIDLCISVESMPGSPNGWEGARIFVDYITSASQSRQDVMDHADLMALTERLTVVCQSIRPDTEVRGGKRMP